MVKSGDTWSMPFILIANGNWLNISIFIQVAYFGKLQIIK